MSTNMIQYILCILCGYLSGGVLYGYLIPKAFGKGDITAISDDGNPGTANVYKYCGVLAGTLTVFCELCKGTLPIYYACHTLNTQNFWFALVMAAPVLGHAFPIYPYANTSGMRGGKSIAVSFGVLIGLVPETTPLLILIVFYLTFSLVIKIYTHFYRSIITFVCFGATCLLVVANKVIALGCCLNTVIVVLKHLARFKEDKFSVVLPGRFKEDRRKEKL